MPTHDKTTKVPREAAQVLMSVERWYQLKRDQLQIILDAPEESTLVFQPEGDEELKITNPKVISGFRAGIMIALETFGDLPFSINNQESNHDQTN